MCSNTNRERVRKKQVQAPSVFHVGWQKMANKCFETQLMKTNFQGPMQTLYTYRQTHLNRYHIKGLSAWNTKIEIANEPYGFKIISVQMQSINERQTITWKSSIKLNHNWFIICHGEKKKMRNWKNERQNGKIIKSNEHFQWAMWKKNKKWRFNQKVAYIIVIYWIHGNARRSVKKCMENRFTFKF